MAIYGDSSQDVTLSSTGGTTNTVAVGAIGSADQINTVAITGSSGITLNGGITTSDAVRKFVGDFRTCYYYRGTFQIQRPSNRPVERGCLLHQYGGRWVALGLCAPDAGGGFDELDSFDQQPSRERLSQVNW